ncbi:MAG: DUF1566 domain-containing protein [Chitinispirillia bacterium]|jgi:hypothetical protein
MKASMILVFLMFNILHVSAEDRDVLDILPFSGKGIGKNELREISIFLRNDINKSGKYRVMDYDSLISLLKQKGIKDINSCNEIECARILGEVLHKKYIAQGRIGKIKDTYAVNLRIIDVTNTRVLLDIEEFFTGTEYGLKNTIIMELTEKIVSVKLENREFSLQDKIEGISANSMLFRPVTHPSKKVPILSKELAIKKQSQTARRFRAKPIHDLRPDDVKKMIADYDFFCAHSTFSSQWSNPRQMKTPDYFVPIPGDCTVVDANSHLMWEREGSQRKFSIDQVSSYIDSINKINFGGFSDWRLPSLDEAMSIMVSEKRGGVYTSRFFSSKQNTIWTCDKVNPVTSWVVRYDKGRCNFGTYKYLRYIRLVRSIKKINSASEISATSVAVRRPLDTN